MPSRCLHLYKTTKVTHVKIVISKNDTKKKRSSPTNKMAQYCKWCYSYCSYARILFQQISSLHGCTSNMQKKKQKLVKKTPSHKIFASLHFKFPFENRNAVLFSDKDVPHKHQDAAFSYTAESFIRKSNVKQHITTENMATISSGEKYKSLFSA